MALHAPLPIPLANLADTMAWCRPPAASPMRRRTAGCLARIDTRAKPFLLGALGSAIGSARSHPPTTESGQRGDIRSGAAGEVDHPQKSLSFLGSRLNDELV